MALSVTSNVGRLVELRVETPIRVEEAKPFILEIMRVTNAVAGRFVAVTDLRGASKAADPASVDLIAGLMRSENPKLERHALIVSAGAATLALQVERMVKGGGSTSRRLFKSRTDGEAWLGEVLTPAERARLAQFLDEAGAA